MEVICDVAQINVMHGQGTLEPLLPKGSETSNITGYFFFFVHSLVLGLDISVLYGQFVLRMRNTQSHNRIY